MRDGANKDLYGVLGVSRVLLMMIRSRVEEVLEYLGLEDSSILEELRGEGLFEHLMEQSLRQLLAELEGR